MGQSGLSSLLSLPVSLPPPATAAAALCTTLTRIYFEACHATSLFFHPRIRRRVPGRDHGFFGVGWCIAARKRPCSSRSPAPPKKSLCCGRKCFSGSAHWLIGTRQLLPPICGLRDDVMRNLFTCVSVAAKMLKFDTTKCFKKMLKTKRSSLWCILTWCYIHAYIKSFASCGIMWLKEDGVMQMKQVQS